MSHPTEPPQPYDPALTDLPPVEAPSAGFIVQLFVIPAVIVAVVIVVWLLFGKLAGGERDAMEYVRLLRSPNAHWRAAYELASLIQNDPKLANDPKLLGELTDLLAHDLDLAESPELTQYVTLTLGAFQTLDARSPDGRDVDPLAILSRALEPKQPPQVRLAAAISLAKHAARLDDHLEDAGAIKALDVASEDENQELRQAAVYSLGFFGGDQAARVLRDRLKDVDCYVRYNAAIALGRRGDSESRGVLREMLSSTDLNKTITLSSPTEKHSKIEAIELEALQALQLSVDHKSPGLAESLRPEISSLSKSGLVSVRNRSLALLKSLPDSP
ncbi:PBS lyase HEAT-like repeat-containing protein [Singulisphaera sp. GP187]|uniref:HEAT repeat domain-containing protein n=1 Tax=Singulisphaera sp. GP187 TaxID=1882752 RepID=UPI000929D5F2|nr:HEAT repeat domain-containing protein [Singulisphaera sp. GP187]SIO66311.1 PBS lyase HEAT-like repeat-containing protein [Singulisphaera sp. GP187]